MVFVFQLLLTVLFVVMQVLIFNHIHLYGGIALVFLYTLLKWPVQTPRWLQIVIGFCVGLLIDIFCNTLGQHALTATTFMWLRVPILHSFVLADDVKSGIPGLRMLSMSVFLRFALISVIVYNVMLYSIEAFTISNFGMTFVKALISILLTYVFIITLEISLNRK